jgi:hypothetical protein
MHVTHQLFNAEEAFVRVGQTRQAGCLIILSPEGTVRLFVDKGMVVSAQGEQSEGAKALERALSFPDASHVWIPDAKPAKKTMDIDISAYALKNSVARDIHIAKTGKVGLGTEKAAPKAGKKNSRPYYLIAEESPGKKIVIDKATVILGRDDSCDIVLESLQVSRRHCLMQIIARGLSFRDLDSTNGCAVNGFPAQEGILSPGDKLSLGTFVLLVHQDD